MQYNRNEQGFPGMESQEREQSIRRERILIRVGVTFGALFFLAVLSFIGWVAYHVITRS
jgi:hypothetical protein